MNWPKSVVGMTSTSSHLFSSFCREDIWDEVRTDESGTARGAVEVIPTKFMERIAPFFPSQSNRWAD